MKQNKQEKNKIDMANIIWNADTLDDARNILKELLSNQRKEIEYKMYGWGRKELLEDIKSNKIFEKESMLVDDEEKEFISGRNSIKEEILQLLKELE